MRVSEAPPPKGKPKPRTIDVPLEELPPIDEHAIEIEAPAEAAWDALFPTLEHSFDRPKARRYAERVGRENVIAGSDCGYGTWVGQAAVDPEVVFAKLKAMADGAAIASKKFW